MNLQHWHHVSIQRLWGSFFSPDVAYSSSEIPLVVSLCYYTSTLLLCRLLHSLNAHLSPPSVRVYLADAISSFQLVACSLENVMIRNSYGMAGYLITLFTISAWFGSTTAEGISNPTRLAAQWAGGKLNGWHAARRAVVQVTAGLFSVRYAQGFWWMGLTAGHAHRSRQVRCAAGLSVPWPVGMALEAGGGLLDSLLGLGPLTPFFVGETLAKAAVGTTLTYLGVHLTGMYLNPVNAFAQEFGCHGVHPTEHFIVYWLGPVFAAVAAVRLQPHLRALVKTVVTSKEKRPALLAGICPPVEVNRETPAWRASRNRGYYQGKVDGSPSKGPRHRRASKKERN